MLDALSAPAVLHSLQVGLPQTLGDEAGALPPWRSGIVKAAVTGPVHLGVINLAGDAQADLRHHGGPDKAVCAYPLCHYPYWAQRLALGLVPGAFGENFTVDGQDERDVCIGDVYAIGEARVQVTQPRSPCWKLARRWHRKALALWVQQTGFTGWYLRVLQTGAVEAGQPLVREARPYPEWTIDRVNTLRYHDPDPDAAARLANCDALSAGWRERFRRLAHGDAGDEAARLQGPAAPGTPAS